jgi:exodeoxyribonuclease VII small subunit
MTQHNKSVEAENQAELIDRVSFNEAYSKLEAIASKLRSSENQMDIDSLIPDVQMAMQAYEVCKSRLAEVTEALDKQLGNIKS